MSNVAGTSCVERTIRANILSLLVFGTASLLAQTAPQEYVTSLTAGTERQDFTGWVGTHVEVGPNPLTVFQLGRRVINGNTASHTIKLVKASDGTDVLGGAVTIATAGQPPGVFKYQNLAIPITLAPNTAYYLVSDETYAGDKWYDSNTTVTTTGAATTTGFVWYVTTWGSQSALNVGVVGLNFKYTEGTPTPYITSATPGTLRSDFTGWVGTRIVVGANPLLVQELGRLVIAGNTSSHSLKMVRASDGMDVPNTTVTVATGGAVPGTFRYATLPAPVTLAANTKYFVVSYETINGDQWYDSDLTVITNPGAAIDGFAYRSQQMPSWGEASTINKAPVVPNLRYIVLAGGPIGTDSDGDSIPDHLEVHFGIQNNPIPSSSGNLGLKVHRP